MAILLKNLLSEGIHYFPPYVDVTLAGRSDLETRKSATRLFYDFYAMEFLHRSLGTQPQVKIDPKFKSYQNPTNATKMQIALASIANVDPIGAMATDWDNVEIGGSNIVPHKMREVIDNVFEEVTFAISRKLLQHLRLTCVQELRHLVIHSPSWQNFQYSLVSLYNTTGTITNADVKTLIAKYLPDMVQHEESTKRLLLFCRYYSKMTGIGSEYPADIIAKNDTSKKPTDEPEPEPEELDTTGYIDYSTNPPDDDDDDDDSDTVDYDTEIEPPPYDEKELSPSNTNQDTSYTSHDKYWDPEVDKSKLTEDCASGNINPSTIKKIFNAIHKAHLTWDDIVLAYTNIPWNSAYGGTKWGSGVVAFLNLVPRARSHDAEKMSGLIDHIFDLVHNGGNLLNKGGMFIKNEDLDRRSKVTHVARYLPDVSPLVKRLILRALEYLPGDSNIEKDIGKITNSPTKPFEPQQQVDLITAKLHLQGDVFTVRVPFQKKKGVDDTKLVNRYYTVKSHINGMFSASDSLNADIQVFQSFPKLMEFVNSTLASEIKSAEEHGGTVPLSSNDAKTQYINTHSRVKLNDVKEQELLDKCKMGWRTNGKYYKAYFPGDKRFLLYAFSNDRSFLTTFKNSKDFNVFQEWDQVFKYCESMTISASPYPDMKGALAAMGKSVPAGINPPVSSSPGHTPSAAGDYQLPPYSISNAAYKAHVGIENEPKHTLRLTAGDEAAIALIGFQPMMVGADVWYIHKLTSDCVKFYPNGYAKIYFPKKKTGGSPVLKKMIDIMLAWLPTKYSTSTTTSPVNVPIQKQPNASMSKGISMDTSIFKSKINDAGFMFDETVGQYYDGNNTLKINPNRSSILTIKDKSHGEDKVFNFKNLPELLAYLTKDYPNKKQIKSVNKDVPTSNGFNLKQAELMDKTGFHYVGPVSDDGFAYKSKEADTIIIYPNQIFKVYDAAHGTWSDFSTSEELTTYLQEKYGSVHVDDLGGIKTSSKNEYKYGITFEENDKISAMVDTVGKQFWTNYISNSLDQSAYVEIFEKKSSKDYSDLIYTVGAAGNYYQINDANNNPIKTSYDFDELLNELTTWLTAVSLGNKPILSTIAHVNNNFGQIVDEINTLLMNAGILTRDGDVDNYKRVSNPFSHGKSTTTGKIAAIDVLRKYILEKTGNICGLAASKWAVEHFPLFMKYITANGLPKNLNTELLTKWGEKNCDYVEYASLPYESSDATGLAGDEQLYLIEMAKHYGMKTGGNSNYISFYFPCNPLKDYLGGYRLSIYKFNGVYWLYNFQKTEVLFESVEFANIANKIEENIKYELGISNGKKLNEEFSYKNIMKQWLE